MDLSTPLSRVTDMDSLTPLQVYNMDLPTWHRMELIERKIMFFFSCVCLRTHLEVGERAENSVHRVARQSQISGFLDFR